MTQKPKGILRSRVTALGMRVAGATLICWLMGSPLCKGQLITTAAINGTVVDQSGAGVPEAKVTITDVGTGTVTQTVSNAAGSFSEAGLAVGTYKVIVAKAGFSSFQESGIYIGPANIRTVNAVLKPSAVMTRVSVQASAAQVQTSTSEISSQVSAQQVEMLPLNGRNYGGLSALMPGVANLGAGSALGTGGFTTFNTMSINGMGQGGSLYTVDGIWNENTGSMRQTTITPDPDQIQEVRVLQNNYSPKYSLMGGSVVLVQTKSGTQTFHGGAWEYLRNDAVDARNFFSPTVPALKQNIFGFDLGGPLYIPHHYNTQKQKTFFYLNSQWVRQDAASVLLAPTPTETMRNGAFPTGGPFAATLKNPLTGQPFPNNTIPASMINANSLAFLNALYPQPNNLAGGFDNYLNLTPDILNQRDDEGRIDQNINSKLRLTAEYMDERQTGIYSAQSGPYSAAGFAYPTNHEVDTTENQLAQIQFTQILSPSMVNQTSIAMNNYVANEGIAGIWLVSQVPNFSENLPFKGFLSNRLPIVTMSGGWASEGVSTNLPLPHAGDLEDTLSDDWSWLRGNHFFGAGALVLLGTKRQTATGQSNGDFSFTGLFTGNSVADLLIGDAASFSQTNTEPRYYFHYPMVSPYVQDRWKVTRRLTITAGVRMSFRPFAHDQYDFGDVFDPADYNPAQAPIVNSNGTITATANYNPLNGLIFNGVNGVPLNFTNAHEYYWLPSIGFAWDVFGDGRTALRGGYGITSILSAGNVDVGQAAPANYPFVSSVTLVNPSFPNPVGAKVSAATVPGITTEDLAHLQGAQIQSYSLSLEHQFRTNWYVSIAGAGDIDRHLPGRENINYPLPFGAYNYNPVINAGTNSTYYYAPYAGYGAITMDASDAVAYWNALEINVRHPVGHNLLLTAAYTWSHNLTNSPGTDYASNNANFQDPYNPGLDYGNSTLNYPQIFTTSLIYGLPWFQSGAGWKSAALGGWKFSEISDIQSGSSLTPSLSVSKAGLANRPNLVGAVTGPKSVSEWFNTNAFVQPAAGFYGNAAPGSILGPGLIDFDMAVYKDFHITERHTIEFRSEFFNILNHANLSGVTTALGSGSFGHVTSATDPRILEFALRYQF
jgi:hypothetical protein